MTRPPADAGPEPRALRADARSGWPVWIGILAVALLARLAFVVLLPANFVFSDTVDYDRMARQILDQHTFGLLPLRAPGYPAFMALVYLVTGKSVTALRVIEAVLGTVSVAVIGALGSLLFGRRAGWIAAAIAALHPVMAFLPSAIYTENLLIFFIVLALLMAYRGLERPGRARWAAAGALLGIALLIRPNLVAMLPGLALGFAFAMARTGRSWIGPALATGLALVLAVLPWTVRNHRVYGHWFFICTGGGRQFYYGNNPDATGTTWFHPDVNPALQTELDRLPDAFERDRYLYRKGWEFIREHPAHAARLYLTELGNLWALYPETVTRTLMNRWSRISQTLASLVIYLGALLALRRWRAEPALWPMLLGIVTFTLANALVYSSMRYRMVFEPCLILMAGLGYDHVLRARMPRAAS